MAATLKDIARQLGISVSTVSYALNGGPRPVPETVRDQVLAVARELDYRPNSLARSMITGRTNTIAVILPRITPGILLSPYIQSILNGIVDACEPCEQDVLLHTSSRDVEPADAARKLLGGRADGFVFIAPLHESMLEHEIASRGVPCVSISTRLDAEVPSFGTDNAGAVRTALEYLVSLGHRRIAHIAGADRFVESSERLEAYLAFMRQHDLPVANGWIECGGFEIPMGREAARRMLVGADLPTAIFAANDESAVGVLEAARDLGIAVPRQLSVVGFDDASHATVVEPKLTTLRQPLGRMAGEGTEALVEWISTRSRPAVMHRLFAADLIVRGSTAPLSAVAA